MSLFHNNALIGSSGQKAGDDDFRIKKSIRLSSDPDGAYFSRTPNIKGNRRTWTWSGWVKRSRIGSSNVGSSQSFIFACIPDLTNFIQTYFSGNSILVDIYQGGSSSGALATTQKFKDTAAWLAVTINFDSTQSIASERLKIWVNGSLLTSFTTDTRSSITQFMEARVNDTASHSIGAQKPYDSTYADMYISNVHFIDGLSLTPASFGGFDSAGVYQPKAFNLPSFNDGTNHSSTVTATSNFDSSYPHSNLFDGDVTTRAMARGASNSAYDWFGVEWPEAIEFNNSLRVYAHMDGRSAAGNPGMRVTTDKGVVYFTGQEIAGAGNETVNWVTIVEGKGSFTKIEQQIGGHTDYGNSMRAVEVDGRILVDGSTDPSTRHNPNDGGTWSTSGTLVNTVSSGGGSPAGLFNGSLDSSSDSNYIQCNTNSSNPSDGSYTFAGSGLAFTKLEVAAVKWGGDLKVNDVNINSKIQTNWADPKWVDITSLITSPLTKLTYQGNGSNKSVFFGVKVDGHELRDDSTDNSFYLDFNDSSSDVALGKDSLMGLISDSTGGLPIYNTTGDRGEKKGTGYRSDSAAGTTDGTGLVFAMPGDTLTDIHASINTGSSNNSLTTYGDPTVSTSDYKFYGSSIKFDGTTDYLVNSSSNSDFSFGTGDFCVECWVKNDVENSHVGIFQISFYSTGITTENWEDHVMLAFKEGQWKMHSNGSEHLVTDSQMYNRWKHVAYTRKSGTMKLYVDGISVKSHSCTFDYAGTYVAIGAALNNTNRALNGSIQDFRIYKGTSKYSGNFRPPARNSLEVHNLEVVAPQLQEANTIYATNASGSTMDSPTAYRSDNVAGTTDGTGLVLAIPGGVNTNDVHANINTGSSNHSVSASGAATSTTQSKFYGKSIYFDGSDDYLSVANSADFGTLGTGDFTIEGWFYSTNNGSDQYPISIWDYANGGSRVFAIRHVNGNLRFSLPYDGSSANDMNTSSNRWTQDAWHHVAVCRDGTTIRGFIDGYLDFTSSNQTGSAFSNTSHDLFIGRINTSNTGYNWEGYMNDIRFYKGVAKYKSAFTPSVAPIDLDERIDITNESPSNHGEDTCAGGELTGNFCVWNQLGRSEDCTITGGGLNCTFNTTIPTKTTVGTFEIPSSGKYYWETRLTSSTGNTQMPGIGGLSSRGHNMGRYGNSAYTYNYNMDGQFRTNDVMTSYGDSYAVNDYIGTAFDADNGNLYFYKNGVIQNSGTPAQTGLTSGPYFPAIGDNSGSGEFTSATNFGARSFKYPGPSGYKCLCSTNLSDSFASGDDVNNAKKVFDIVTWTGTDTTQIIGGLDFQPGLVFIQPRNYGVSAPYFDVVRGATKALYFDMLNGDTTMSTGLTAFSANGFTLGGNSETNKDEKTYVGWCFNAGSSITPSSSYDITPDSQYVNEDAGFSITKWTGNGSTNQRLPHGLTTAPGFAIMKKIAGGSTNGIALIKHAGTDADKVLALSSTMGQDDDDTWYGIFHDHPDAVTLKVSSHSSGAHHANENNSEYITYCWSPRAGYSKFGSFEGTAETGENGPFIYTGFKVEMLWLKAISTTSNWLANDMGRDINGQYGNDASVKLNSADTEFTSSSLNVFMHSNGFQINSTTFNADGTKYAYAAWGSPFKTTRAQ